MLDVVALPLVTPRRRQLMDLDGDIAQTLQVEGVPHFAEAPLAQQLDDLIPIVEQLTLAVLTALLVAKSAHLTDVRLLHDLQLRQLLLIL